MSKSIQHRVIMTLGAAAFVSGVIIIVVAKCATGPIHTSDTRVVLMGYSSGEEAFNGACKSKPDLLSCAECCVTSTMGLPPEEKEICIGLCIAHHGGSGAALDQLVASGKVIRDRDTSELANLKRWNAHKTFIRVCSKHPNKTVSGLAAGLVAQLGIEAAS